MMSLYQLLWTGENEGFRKCLVYTSFIRFRSLKWTAKNASLDANLFIRFRQKEMKTEVSKTQ